MESVDGAYLHHKTRLLQAYQLRATRGSFSAIGVRVDMPVLLSGCPPRRPTTARLREALERLGHSLRVGAADVAASQRYSDGTVVTFGEDGLHIL
jgi:hypothetical protein